MVSGSQLDGNLHGTFEPRKRSQPAHAKAPPDPEADHIAHEAAEPADRKQRAETQRAGMRGVSPE